MNKNFPYWLSLGTLVLGYFLMEYLARVYFVGIIIFFVIILFQTPSPKYDNTGEVNDANIAILKLVGLHALMFLAGGYIASMI